MRRVLLLLTILAFGLSGFAQTTFTAHLFTGLTQPATTGQVCLHLKNVGTSIPYVVGTGVVADTDPPCIPAASNGTVTGTIYGSDVIALTGCVPSALNPCTYWTVEYWVNGQMKSTQDYSNIVGASVTLDALTPMTTIPVVAAPTGDSTYVRRDGANVLVGDQFLASPPPMGGTTPQPIKGTTITATTSVAAPTVTATTSTITPSLALNGAQQLTGVQGTTGTKAAACTGSFTNGNLRSTDANGNCVDSGLAANNVPLLGGASNAWTGTFSKYNNVATVGNGIAAEVAAVDLTAQQANISATTFYTVPATGMYRISFYAIETRAATTSSTLPTPEIYFTDFDNSTQQYLSATFTSGASVNSLQVLFSGVLAFNAKSGTVIQYLTAGYASVGATAMQYALHVRLEAL